MRIPLMMRMNDYTGPNECTHTHVMHAHTPTHDPSQQQPTSGGLLT